MRVLRGVLIAALFLGVAVAQEEGTTPPAPRKAPPVLAAMQAPVAVSPKAMLLDGTPILFRLAVPVKVKEAIAGQSLQFVLSHDLYYRDVLLARAGTPVEAHVVDAQKAKHANRGSKLAIDIRTLALLNGQTIELNGYTEYKGGSGGSAQVAGTLFTEFNSSSPCPICEVAFAPAALVVFLSGRGENKDLPANMSAPAFVAGDWDLDLASFRRFQPSDAAHTGKVRIVRGHYGSAYGRDLYCNGVPLAHLNAGRKLELDLKPGYYRFLIDTKKPWVELYVPAGGEANLLADYHTLAPLREDETNRNTFGVTMFGHKDNAGELLQKAKPPDAADLYANACEPLPEQPSPPANVSSTSP